MTRNDYRVYSKNDAELEVATKKSLQLAIEGGELDEYLADPNVAASSPELIENKFLAQAIIPQYFRSSILIKLESLEKDFIEKWDEAEKGFSPEDFADLKTEVTAILSMIKNAKDGKDILLREANGHLERLRKNNEDVRTFFNSLKKLVEKLSKERRLNETHLEFNRGLCIDDEPVSSHSSVDRDSEINKFKDRLNKSCQKKTKQNLNQTLIDFSVEYVNLENLMAGAGFFAEPLSKFIQKGELAPDDSSQREQKVNVTVESPDSILVTYRKLERFKKAVDVGHSNDSLLNEPQTESFLQYRISLIDDNDVKADVPFSNVKVEVVDASLNIFDPWLRPLFIQQRNTMAIEKIKENHDRQLKNLSEISLTANEKLAVELYTQDFKTENGDVDNVKLKNVSAESLFALLWNNVGDAENILLAQDFSPEAFFDGKREGFFGREPKECDLFLVSQNDPGEINPGILENAKERNTPILIKRKNKFSIYGDPNGDGHWKFTEINSKGIDLTKLPFDERIKIIRRNDPLFSPLLTETLKKGHTQPNEIIKDLTIIKSKHYVSKKIEEAVDDYIKLLELINKRDIKSIKHELQNSKPKMLMCLHSISDIKFVKNLLKYSEIKNNLDEPTLAYFATLDKSIATSLLKPSLWERIKFRVRSYLRYTAPDEKLPKDRFTSSGLKRIVEKFPIFWTTLFRKPKKPFFQSKETFLEAIRKNEKYKDYYRYKISGDDLKALMDINNRGTISWYKAGDEVTNDTILFERAFPDLIQNNEEEKKPKLPISIQAVYFEENHLMTLERLATYKEKDGKEGTIWEELHEKLDNTQLKQFYKTKFELDYKNDPFCLLNSIIDLWADTNQVVRHTKWASKLYELANKEPEKGYIKIAREALVEVVKDKKLDVIGSTLQAKYKIPGKISITETFLVHPFENAYQEEFFSKDAMHHLQTTLLNNSAIFNSVFDEPERLGVDGVTRFILANPDDFILLFENESFKKLATSQPQLFESLKKAFETTSVKKLAANHYRLNTLISEMSNTPPFYKEKAVSYNLIIELYNDERFLAMIQQIPGMVNDFEKLLARARFKMQLRKDLFLFKTIWEIAKKLPSKKLLELSFLLPPTEFKSWLELKENAVELDFLITKVSLDPEFYAEFKKQPNDIVEFLLQKANAKQFQVLMLNCDEFGQHYLSTLKTIHLADKDSSDKLNLKEFIQRLSVFDLSILIMKYPGSIKKPEYPGILKTLVAAGFIDEFQVKIIEAIKQAYALIDQSELQTIKNIHPTFKEAIQSESEKHKVKAQQFPLNNKAMGGGIGGRRQLPRLSRRIQTRKQSPVLQQELPVKDEAIQNELASVYKAKENHPEEVGIFLINELKKEKVHLDTIKAASDPELFVPYLNGAVKYTEIPTQLGEIARLIKTKLGEEALKKFINLLVEKAIADTAFMVAIENNTELNQYLNQITDIHLLAQFIVTKQQTVGGWLEGITRISKDKDLFKQCSTELSSREGYGRWVFKDAVDSKGISYIDSLTEQQIIGYIAKNEFEASNLADWMLNDYNNNQIFKEASRDNIEHYKALKLFLRAASKIPKKLCELAVMDLQLNADVSPFVDLMLSESFLGHLLTTADSTSIGSLLLQLKSELNTQEKFNEVINRYFSLAFERKKVGAKLFESETVINESIEYVEVKDHRTAIKILLLASENTIPLPIKNWMENNHEQILQFFIENKDGNSLIKFYLNLLDQDHSEDALGSLAMLTTIEKSEEAFKLMLQENLNPKLQQKLLIHIFKSDSAAIKSHMQRIALETKLAHLQRILQGLSGNELVDLYLADGMNLGENHSQRRSIILQANDQSLDNTHYFSEFFNKDWVLDRIFLFADDDKLLELFEKSDDIAKNFAKKSVEDNALGYALKRRLAQCNRLDKNFAHMLIEKFSGEFEGIISKLMNSHAHDVYTSFRVTIGNNPNLIIREDKLETNYINLIIKNGSSEELATLINSFGENADKVSKYIFELLTGKNENNDEILTNKLLSYFGTPEKPAINLINAIIATLTTADVSELLLHNPALDKVFLRYFESHSEEFETLFKDNQEVFEKYFALSEQKSSIYLFLHQKLPGSELLSFTIDQLASRELSVPLVSNATSVQLAQIYNLEALNGNDSKPVTQYIFPKNPKERDTAFAIKFLAAWPEVDDSLAFSKDIQDAIQYGRKDHDGNIIGNIEIANKLYHHFDVSYGNPCLKFKSSHHKPVSLNHRIAYLDTLRQKLSYDILQLPEGEGNRYSCYKKIEDYIGSVNLITEFDEEGNLYFKDTNEKIPLEHSTQYFIAISRFFYADLAIVGKRKEAIRATIEQKPAFHQLLSDTLEFDQEGVPRFAFSEEIYNISVPTSYSNMVLYAYSLIPNIASELTPSLANAFVKSITQEKEGSYVFSNAHISPPNLAQRPVPPNYLKLVGASIKYLAGSKTEINVSWIIPSILSLPNLDELLKDNISLALSLIRGIYIEKNRDENTLDIKLRINNESVPEEKVRMILAIALQQLGSIPRSDIPNFLLLLSKFPELNDVVHNASLCEMVVDSVKPYEDGVFRFISEDPKQELKEVPLFYYLTIRKAMLINNKNNFPTNHHLLQKKFTDAQIYWRKSQSIKENEQEKKLEVGVSMKNYPLVDAFFNEHKDGSSQNSSPRIKNMWGSDAPEEEASTTKTISVGQGYSE